MTPKEVMVKASQEWMRGDFGHDLPAEDFEDQVDRQLEALKGAGFVITNRINSFAVGDRVKHLAREGLGIVISLAGECVHVRFEGSKSVGIYDANWFRMHPDLLQHVTQAVTKQES